MKIKTAVISGLEYPVFEKIRDVLMARIPFAYDCEYSKKLKKGKFKFEDTSYVPNCLWRFVLGIKGNNEQIMKANREISDILDANDFGRIRDDKRCFTDKRGAWN